MKQKMDGRLLLYENVLGQISLDVFYGTENYVLKSAVCYNQRCSANFLTKRAQNRILKATPFKRCTLKNCIK